MAVPCITQQPKCFNKHSDRFTIRSPLNANLRIRQAENVCTIQLVLHSKIQSLLVLGSTRLRMCCLSFEQSKCGADMIEMSIVRKVFRHKIRRTLFANGPVNGIIIIVWLLTRQFDRVFCWAQLRSSVTVKRAEHVRRSP